MSMMQRAAQFAPFAALTGYDAAIKEAEIEAEMEKSSSEEDFSELFWIGSVWANLLRIT